MFRNVQAPAQFCARIASYDGLLPAFLSGAFSEFDPSETVLQVFCKGQIYSFNLAGALVWKLVEGAESLDAVVAQMSAFYPGSPTLRWLRACGQLPTEC